MGLAGQWKVGFPTRLVTSVESQSTPVEGRLEILSCDGDGVPVVYADRDWKILLKPGESTTIEASIKHGRANRSISVRIVGLDGVTLQEHTLSAEERGVFIPSGQPWVIGIGSKDLRLDDGLMKSTKGALAEYSTETLSYAKSLPRLASSYEGVDLILVSSRNEALLFEVTDEQAAALRDWLLGGGRLVLSLGAKAEAFLKNKTLSDLIPGQFDSIQNGCDPSRLESFLNSQTPLPKLTCAGFNLTSGVVPLTFRSGTSAKFPMLAKWSAGNGKVIFLATEMDSPEITQWKSSSELTKTLLEGAWEKKNARTDKLSFQGYDDIAGQLNSSLDLFPNLTLGNLTSLAMLVGVLCVLIGPIDYFVVSNAWRKPRGTWVTLFLCSMGCCLVAGSLAASWKPKESTINTIELVDVDAKTNRTFGRSFAHFYTGERGAYDFSTHFIPNSLQNSEAGKPTAAKLDWFGQPGRGLGGFESTVATDRGMPTYRIDMSGTGASTDQVESLGITGLGVPTAGTKALLAQWNDQTSIRSDDLKLSLISGSADLLTGSFINPFNVDLLDGLLVYRGRAYALNTRLKANEPVVIPPSMLPKDVVRRLQRRSNVGGEERSTPWSPGSTSNLDRLLELIAFHDAAGGSTYTSLYSRYLSRLDASDTVQTDRAVLLAELEKPVLAWSVHRGKVPIQLVEGQRKTYVRVFIPIAIGSSNNRSQ